MGLKLKPRPEDGTISINQMAGGQVGVLTAFGADTSHTKGALVQRAGEALIVLGEDSIRPHFFVSNWAPDAFRVRILELGEEIVRT